MPKQAPVKEPEVKARVERIENTLQRIEALEGRRRAIDEERGRLLARVRRETDEVKRLTLSRVRSGR